LLGASILILPLFAQSGDEIVSIPDTAFLYALIDVGVDTDRDSLISFNEAESVNYLGIMGRGITDMMGIEAFVSLDTLDCDNNNIETLNLSTLPKLTFLSCGYGNPIDSLDLSNNPGLTELYVIKNGTLTSLDISNNPLLKVLSCEYNQLASLDVSAIW